MAALVNFLGERFCLGDEFEVIFDMGDLGDAVFVAEDDDFVSEDEDLDNFGREESELFGLGEPPTPDELFTLGEDVVLELFDEVKFLGVASCEVVGGEADANGVANENKLDQEEDLGFCGISVMNLHPK